MTFLLFTFISLKPPNLMMRLSVSTIRVESHFFFRPVVPLTALSRCVIFFFFLKKRKKLFLFFQLAGAPEGEKRPDKSGCKCGCRCGCTGKNDVSNHSGRREMSPDVLIRTVFDRPRPAGWPFSASFLLWLRRWISWDVEVASNGRLMWVQYNG